MVRNNTNLGLSWWGGGVRAAGRESVFGWPWPSGPCLLGLSPLLTCAELLHTELTPRTPRKDSPLTSQSWGPFGPLVLYFPGESSV